MMLTPLKDNLQHFEVDVARFLKIRLFVFEVCETIVFVALILVLTIYSLVHIYEFGRHIL
jgi:hypothetical protein